MTFLDVRRSEAISAVGQWVAETVANAARLNADQLREHGRDATSDGWRLPLRAGSGALDLLVDQDFPYSMPRFVVTGRSDLLRAPHVESGGRLCLTGDGGRASTRDPAAVVGYLYQEALSLVNDNTAGGNCDDFAIDFQAYWARDSHDQLPLQAWLAAEIRSRLITAWHAKNFYLLAETPEDAKHWLTNRYGPDRSRVFRQAAYIRLREIPPPELYPDTAAELRQLVKARSDDGLAIFDSLMQRMRKNAVVILAGNLGNGNTGMVGVVLTDAEPESRGKDRKVAISKGFRPGRVPPEVLASRRKARRTQVRRVDAWTDRMRSGEGHALMGKRVVVLGCGSLGSGVARILLQSGVGRIVLVDPDNFDWVNLGRHELGAESVRSNKAVALAKRLVPMYPHVREILAEPYSWQASLRRKPELFQDCDLVLSLIGDWNVESGLNDLQRAGNGELPAPILYGWLEQEAGSAHALAIDSVGPCFRCGFGPTGTIHIPTTEWPKQGPPGCGGPTSIYGAADLAPAQAMVASLAIDLLLSRASAPVRRTWVAPFGSLAQAGGHWHQRWIDTYGDPSPGGRLTATPWPEDPACPCNHR